jgi:hypothetical protein
MKLLEELGLTMLPSKLFGLTARPTYQPRYSDNESSPHPVLHKFYNKSQQDNSPRVMAKVKEVVEGLPNGYGILEIGVALYKPEYSFSYHLMNHKPENTIYLGVDLEDKSFLNQPDKKVYTLRTNSANQAEIRLAIRRFGIEQLSLLVIDGCHSLNMAINDWAYVDLLMPGGIVLIHDTNTWFGPVALVNSIDRTMFDVEMFFREYDDDYGLTLARIRCNT